MSPTVVPAAILMSGTGSNARKILARPRAAYQVRVIVSDNPLSNYRGIAEEFGAAHRLNDIYAFCGTPHPGEGATFGPEQRAALRDPERRAAFDRRTEGILDEFGVQLVAAAGYDWVISPRLCGRYWFVNVHPGDLRVADERGRRRYVGLAWVPSAKAILAGESLVHSTTHLLTAALDGGPIARVSAGVPVELPAGAGSGDLLPPGVSLREVIEDIRAGGRRFGRSLLYREACRLQERLKQTGDWVEFPGTLDGVARLLLAGRLARGPEGEALLAGGAVPDGFLMDQSPSCRSTVPFASSPMFMHLAATSISMTIAASRDIVDSERPMLDDSAAATRERLISVGGWLRGFVPRSSGPQPGIPGRVETNREPFIRCDARGRGGGRGQGPCCRRRRSRARARGVSRP